MNKKDALNILIANTVCISTELHCDTDCPFYDEETQCKHLDKDFQLKEAVNALKGGLI